MCWLFKIMEDIKKKKSILQRSRNACVSAHLFPNTASAGLIVASSS